MMLKLQPYFTNLFNFMMCICLYIYTSFNYKMYIEIYIECIYKSFIVYMLYFFINFASEYTCEKKITYNCLTYSPCFQNNPCKWLLFYISHLGILLFSIISNFNYNNLNDNFFENCFFYASFQGCILLWVFNLALYIPGRYNKNLITREFIFHQLEYYNIEYVFSYCPNNNSFSWFLFQFVSMIFDNFYHMCPLMIMSKIIIPKINMFYNILLIYIVCAIWGIVVSGLIMVMVIIF